MGKQLLAILAQVFPGWVCRVGLIAHHAFPENAVECCSIH